MVVLMGLASGVNPGWAAPAETPPHRALQQAIIDGLAAGQDVKKLLDILRQQPAPTTDRPLRPQHTVFSDLKSHLIAFREVLEQAVQAPLSSDSITAVEQAYQRLQAAHMLMLSRFDHVQSTLQIASVPETFEHRRQDAFRHYDRILQPLLAPLWTPLTEWQQAPDRAALLDTAAFRHTLREALREAAALIKPHLHEPAPPILRAQALPVRPATPASREPRTQPAIEPSYVQPDLPEPQSADLAGISDAPLQEAILQQAQALDYDPIRIYEFVRNEIETQAYAGAMKGALGTLRQQSGNAMDQASLLIALLRASSLPARYVHGVIRLPIEHVVAGLGFTSHASASPPLRALRATQALSAAGIAHRPLIAGGRVTAMELESTWVSAYVPYTNYRGAMVDASGSIWVPLMPAIKDTAVEPAARMLHEMQTPVETLITDYLAQPQTADLRTYLEQALAAEVPASEGELTEGQSLGARHLIPVRTGLLPATLPAEVVVVTQEAPALEDTQRQRLRLVARVGVQESAPIILDYTVPVAEVASQRFTLSYLPATADDQRVANLYSGLDHVPAYLVKLRPQLKRNGRLLAVATEALDTGVPYRFEMQLIGPAGSEQVTQTLISGGYHAIGISAQEGAFVAVQPDDPGNTEFLAAALLYRVAAEYSQQWTEAEDAFAALTDVALVRPWPHVVMVNNAMQVDTIAGRPHQLHWRGVTLDAALRLSTPIARRQARTAEREWLQLSALQGSLLEHRLFEQLFLVESISADKGLQLARSQGVPIHRIEAHNLQAVLPSLPHPQAVLDAIAEWVGLGLSVEVPATLLSYQDWQGSVWRVVNPTTGAAGYFIAGGLAGGATSVEPTAWALALLREIFSSPNTALANPDPLAAASITMFSASDGQTGEAGEALPMALAVYVADAEGRPVKDAEVTFRLIAGDGCFRICAPEGQANPKVITVLTDATGIAAVTWRLGKETGANPIYVRRQPDDLYQTLATINLIDVAVSNAQGETLKPRKPFHLITFPKPVARIENGNKRLESERRAGTYDGAPGRQGELIQAKTLDTYGNPVSNVNLRFDGQSVLAEDKPCDFVPMQFVAIRDEEKCPVLTFKSPCAKTPLVVSTSWYGVGVETVMPVRARSNNIVTIEALEHPSVPPKLLTFEVGSRTGENSCFSPYYEIQEGKLLNFDGSSFDAVLAGAPIHTDLTAFRTSETGATRVEVPGGLTHTTYDSVNGPGSKGANVSSYPMQYRGKGRYTVSVITHPGPRLYVREANWYDDYEHHFNTTPLSEITGVKFQITEIASPGAARSLQKNVIELDAQNRSRHEIHVHYDLQPSEYLPFSVDIHILEDGQFQYTVGVPQHRGAGHAILPRYLQYRPDRSYTARVVLNRGSPAELHSPLFPIRIKAKLILSATQRLSLSQEVDVVNQRSCLQSQTLRFTLSKTANVSLVFADQHDPDRTEVAIDNHVFPKGTHAIPFYLPAFKLAVPDGQPFYSLEPGEYTFALTAVDAEASIDNREAILGKAVIEYKTTQVPAGRTLVRDVDVSNGNLILSTTDMEVPGRGAHLMFQRAYSANTAGSLGPLGVGWRHNYQSRVVQDVCGTAIVTGGIGGGSRFIRTPGDQGEGHWTPLKGYHGTLRYQNADDTFDFYSPDGTQYHYRQVLGVGYRLDAIADPNGNLTKLGYDPANAQRLITVEDPSKRRFTLTYDTRSFTLAGTPTLTSVITDIQAPGGQQLQLDYDSHGNLVWAAREGEARVETYTYYPDHPVLLDPITHSMARLHGKLATYTNPNGVTTTYSHGSEVHDRIVTVSLPGGGQVAKPMRVTFPFIAVQAIQAPGRGAVTFAYDHLTPLTIVTNGRSAATRYILNEDGAVIAQHDALGNTTRTTWSARHLLPESRINAKNVTTTYAYDDDGNVLSEAVAGLTTTYTYAQLQDGTIKNRVTSKTDRNGHLTQFRYDHRGNLLSLTNAMGGITTHTYTAKGDRLSTRDPLGRTTKFEYDPNGLVKTRTDALGGTTLTQWDERSRPVQITDAGGNRTGHHYDTLNRLTQRTDALDQVRTWTYDSVGNRMSETDEAKRTTRFGYDAANRLVSITDALGATQTITYDAQDNKTGETDFRGNPTTLTYDLADRMTQRLEPLGRQTQWRYDPVGQVTGETDAMGRKTQFEYDDLGRRIKITDALGGITQRRYDGVGNLTQEINANQQVTALEYDALDRLVRRTQPLGRITSYAYDAVGNQVRETDANSHATRLEYDALSRLIQHSNAMGEVTAYDYDVVGNVTRQVDPRRHETVHLYDPLNRVAMTTDTAGYQTEYAYDEVGNVVATTLPNRNVVQADYDALNRLTRQRDNLGVLRSYSYDADGNRTLEIDAGGHITTNTYDALSRWVQQALPENRTRRFDYDPVGNRTLEIDAGGHPTTFEYDDLNRLITTIDALGHTLKRTYDPVGNPADETDPRHYTTRFEYDALNQLVKVTDPLGQSIIYVYDPVGNRLSETDKRGITSRYTYDKANRRLTTERASTLLRQVKYDNGGNVVIDIDANRNITTYLYDPRHLATLESRPLAAVTQHDYDAMGDRTATTDPEGRRATWRYDERRRVHTETNGAHETTTYIYDDNGNRTGLKRPSGQTQTFEYDPANRLVEVRDPTGASTVYTYDDNDNRLTQTDASGLVTTFSYDEVNRLKKVQYPDEAVIRYTYDGSGNRTGAIDANGQGSISTYDALNRLAQTTYSNLLTPTGDDLSRLAYSYDANDNLVRVHTTYSGATGTLTTVRSYDPQDRLSTTTQADGATLTYGYDPQGNRLSLSVTGVPSTRYGYDALHRMASVITRQGITEYGYDRSSRLTRTTYPSGTETRQSYDGAGRLTQIEHTHYGVPMSRYHYRYDPNGNRTEEAITRGNVTEVTTYAYDAVDRLTAVAYPDRSTLYTYDAASNRLSEQSRSRADDTWVTDKTFHYNSRDQVTEVSNRLDSSATATYTYDASGNRTQQHLDKQSTAYLYDARHRLRQMTRGGSTLGAFVYDWQGLRVRQHTPAETRRYVYDNQSVVLVSDDAGAPKSHYIYGPNGLLALDHVHEGPQYYLNVARKADDIQ